MADVLDPKKKFRVTGTVNEALPGTKFRVGVNIQGQDYSILAHLSGKMRMHFIKLVVGDEVELEISPYDLNRGIIVYRKVK